MNEKENMIRLLKDKNVKLVYGLNWLKLVSYEFFSERFEFSKAQLAIIDNISFVEYYNAK